MRFWTQPTVIRVKHFGSYEWIDRTSLIRHAVFQVLVDFIERECPFEHFDTVNSPNAAEWVELKELYDWYKNYKEFDMFEYQNEQLGKDINLKIDSQPIPEHGVDDWGDPKMYQMVFEPRTQVQEEVWREARRIEASKDKEFTDKAKRVLDLHGLLWT